MPWKIERTVLGWEISLVHRPKQSVFGRFGGGWEWELGVQVGGRTALINLLIATLIIRPANPPPPPGPVARYMQQLRQEWGIE